MDLHDSIASGRTGRWIDRGGFALVSVVVVALGYVEGIQTVAVLEFSALNATVSIAMFCGFVCLSGASMLARVVAAARADPEVVESGASVTAIVPVYGDAGVLHRSVESLLAANYEDLSVVVVTEPDDPDSRRRAEAFAEREGVEHLVNTRYTGSKAGAINYAAEVTDGAYLAVFDADERVHPEFLGGAVPKLATADVVQGRTVPEPGGVIESLAYYESVLLGHVSQQMLYLATGFQMATSRAIVMRRSAFETVGGYDPEMLTEDYDFAFRCYHHRLDVVQSMVHPSRIESAHTARDWWGQRKRWMTGYAQTLHHQIASLRPTTDHRRLLSPLICAGSVGGNLVMLTLVSKLGILALEGIGWGIALPLSLVMALALGVRALDVSTGAVDGVDGYWPLVPAVMVVYSFVGVKAMLEYAITWDGAWYAVRKGV